MIQSARPFKRTTTGDFYDAGDAAGNKPVISVASIRLVAAAANATAQVIDGNGTVLADLAAVIGTSDSIGFPIIAHGKVNLAAITGAGAIVLVYIY